MRAEEEAILNLAVTEPAPAQIEDAEGRLQAPFDWQYFLDQCERNHVLSLVYKNLTNHFDSIIPEAARRRGEKHFRHNAIRNLHLTRELSRLVEESRERGLVIVPFKGALLASVAYRDVSLREFADLDVLVQKEQFHLAKSFLVDSGYEPVIPMTPEEEEVYVDAQLGYEFVKSDGTAVVELHWAFLRECHAFALHEDDIWKRLKEVKVGQTSMQALSDEDHLLYLCAHGTKHLWERLSWICDIHEFVRSSEDLDWDTLFLRAEDLGSVRMVNLGLYLASALLGLQLPEEISRRAASDRMVVKLADESLETRLFRDPDVDTEKYIDVFYFLWRSRERFRDRIPYGMYNLKLITRPRIERVKGLLRRKPDPKKAASRAGLQHGPDDESRK